MLNKNLSYKDKCGYYKIIAAELVPAKQGSNKNDYVRLSLRKIKASGRVETRGFSHYHNEGIKDIVEGLKRLGVTAQGISKENLEAWNEAFKKGEDVPYDPIQYGFYWTQPFGAVYRNKETGKISSETLVFIPCDEDTGLPLQEYCMTAERLAEILSGYELVKQETAENDTNQDQEDADDEAEALAKFIEQRRAARS